MTLKQRIEHHEGWRNKPYKDSLGVLTVGVGHRILPGEVTDRDWTDDEVRRAFETDYANAEAAANRLRDTGVSGASYGLSGVRFGVLVEMCFQLGEAGCRKFQRMHGALEAGEYGLAAVEMLDSLWAGQTPKRAFRLARIMATGREDA